MHFDFLQFLCYSYPFSSLFFSVRLFSPYIFLLLFCEIHMSLNSLEAWDSRIWLCSSFTYLLSVLTISTKALSSVVLASRQGTWTVSGCISVYLADGQSAFLLKLQLSVMYMLQI